MRSWDRCAGTAGLLRWEGRRTRVLLAKLVVLVKSRQLVVLVAVVAMAANPFLDSGRTFIFRAADGSDDKLHVDLAVSAGILYRLREALPVGHGVELHPVGRGLRARHVRHVR